MSWMWGVIAVLVSCSALGQQPARIVVGFPPGGSLDALARYLAEPVREALGRPVIVENRAGAAGRLAVEATKAAPPDGNTLMLVPSGPMTLFPYIFSDLRFDPLRDFSPIAQLASQDLCLAAAPTTPARTTAAATCPPPGSRRTLYDDPVMSRQEFWTMLALPYESIVVKAFSL